MANVQIKKEIAYTKILSWTNKDQIINLSKYLEKVKYKQFNKRKKWTSIKW